MKEFFSKCLGVESALIVTLIIIICLAIYVALGPQISIVVRSTYNSITGNSSVAYVATMNDGSKLEVTTEEPVRINSNSSIVYLTPEGKSIPISDVRFVHSVVVQVKNGSAE